CALPISPGLILPAFAIGPSNSTAVETQTHERDRPATGVPASPPALTGWQPSTPLVFFHPMYSIVCAEGTEVCVSYDNHGHPRQRRKSPGKAAGELHLPYLFSTDHKTIGLQYLWLALLSVFVGMAMSLVMRIHLAWPEMHIPFLSALGSSPERYATLPVLHGSLMVFLVLTAAPQLGFGNYFLPLQIGAREMAF